MDANRDIPLMLVAMLLCMALLAVGAALVARRLPRPINVLLAGLCAAAMLLFGRYWTDSVVVAQIVPPRLLPVFGNWLPPFAAMLAGLGWVISPRPAAVKGVTLGALLLLSMYLPYRFLFESRPVVIDQWHRGVCIQSTDATCGAAAAATLLRTIGIESSEEEMVHLCFSTDRGTSMHGIVRGLAIKLQGTPWQVRQRSLTSQQLADLQHPAILEVGLTDGVPADARFVTEWGWIPGVEHTAVVFDVLPGGYLDMGDPTTGRERWSAKALEVLWRGTAITLEKRL